MLSESKNSVNSESWTLQLAAPVRQDSLSTQVYGILKDAIFAGKFQPGEALRELHLAKMFEVSQATIREALVQLEQSGLVVRTHNRKTTVTVLTQDEVRDRIMMRLALEELAFRRACKRIDHTGLETLDRCADAIEGAIQADNILEMTMADVRFHQVVWEQAGSPTLFKTLDQLTTPLFAFMKGVHEKGHTDLRTTRPHKDLIAALRSRNEEDVVRAIRQHITASYERFLQNGTVHQEAEPVPVVAN